MNTTTARGRIGGRIHVYGAHGTDWVVDVPPGSDDCYEGGDPHGGDAPLLGPFGDSYWPTFDTAIAFVRHVLADYDFACGGTGEWTSTTEDQPTTLVSLGACPACKGTGVVR